MEELIRVLNKMEKKGVIERYAICGAVGVLFYAEAVNTKDVDVLVAAGRLSSGIVHLGEIYDFLKKAGYRMKGQHFIVGGVPVDFLADYNDLTREAVEKAVERKYGALKAKVLRPEYLAAIALKTGRAKDIQKVAVLMSEAKIDKALFDKIISRHGLRKQWEKYADR